MSSERGFEPRARGGVSEIDVCHRRDSHGSTATWRPCGERQHTFEGHASPSERSTKKTPMAEESITFDFLQYCILLYVLRYIFLILFIYIPQLILRSWRNRCCLSSLSSPRAAFTFVPNHTPPLQSFPLSSFLINPFFNPSPVPPPPLFIPSTNQPCPLFIPSQPTPLIHSNKSVPLFIHFPINISLFIPSQSTQSIVPPINTTSLHPCSKFHTLYTLCRLVCT